MTEYRQILPAFGVILAQVETLEVSETLNQSKARVRIYHKNIEGLDWNNGYKESNYINRGYHFGLTATFSVDGVDSTWTFTRPQGTRNLFEYYKNENSSGMLYDNEVILQHDLDGRKTFNISVSFKNNEGSVVQNLGIFSINHTLSRISHDLTVTIKGNAIGSPVIIAIKSSTTGWTHKLYWSFGNLSGTIATNTGTSATWTPNISQLGPQIPNLTSGKAKIRMETYVGSKKLGERTYEHTLNLPETVKPTLGGLTLLDGNQKASALNLGTGNFVQMQSNIRPRFDNANGINGSTIVSYRAELQRYVNGKWEATSLSTNANNGLMGNANFSGRARVVAYVTDSRGRRSDTRTVELTYLPYHVPALSFRGDRTGSGNDRINVTRNIKIAPLTVNGRQKNTGRLTFDVIDVQTNQRTNGVGGSADWTGTTEHEKINFLATLNGTYDVGRTYVVIGQLADAFNTVTFEYRVGVEAVPVSISKYGLSIGKEWSRGVLDVGGSDHLPAYFDCDIIVREKPIQMHQLSAKNGRAINVTGDWNNVLNTGFYMGHNLANQPTFPGMHGWKYVRVTKHLDTYVLQEAVDFNGAVVCYRVKLNNAWQPWKQLATTDLIGSQKHKLSEDNGVAIQVTGDWNNVTKVGFYVGVSLANEPKFANMAIAKFVKVSNFGDTFVLQEAIDTSGKVSCYRVKSASGWQPWKEYIVASNRIDWTSTGMAGVQYKVSDDVVSLSIDIARLSSSSVTIGTIPRQFLPPASGTVSFQLPGAMLDILVSGSIRIQNGIKGSALHTQVTWQI